MLWSVGRVSARRCRCVQSNEVGTEDTLRGSRLSVAVAPWSFLQHHAVASIGVGGPHASSPSSLLPLHRTVVPVPEKPFCPCTGLAPPTRQYKNSAPLVLLSRSLIKKYKRSQPRLSEHLCLLVASHYGGVGSESDTPVGSCFLVGSSSVMAMSLRCRFIGRTYICLVHTLT